MKTQRLTFNKDMELVGEELVSMLQESDIYWETGFAEGGNRIILVAVSAEYTLTLLNKAVRQAATKDKKNWLV